LIHLLTKLAEVDVTTTCGYGWIKPDGNGSFQTWKDFVEAADMGTGGGEFLAALAPLPDQTFATEGYDPNVKVAQDRLEPLGVKVIHDYTDEQLPFESGSLQLIINRHESFSSSEVHRILAPGGTFITQQVGGQNFKELHGFLRAADHEYQDFNLDGVASDLENAGFKLIYRNEILTKTRIYDIGAVLYYLKAIVWEIPDFTIEKYEGKLRELHEVITEAGYFDATCHRFVVVASKG
jgi:SAM-dependent methyltransferase